MPKKFDFISPGVQLNEIDESVLPAQVRDAGPVLIGRALSGPAMQPVIVNNYADFVAIFGEPVSGEGASDADVWRDGNVVGPTYASYAAQAHLSSETTPLTFVRLLGEKSSQATDNDSSAGWWLGSAGAASATMASNITAYGLFIWPKIASGTYATGSLGAIIYANGCAVTLSGTVAGGSATTSSAGVMINSLGNVASQFKIEIWDDFHDGTTTGSPTVSKNCHFTNGSANFIRDQLNTNPQKLKGAANFGTTNTKYFLGQTFEQAILDEPMSGSQAAGQVGMILPLQQGSLNYADFKINSMPAKTGWFINRKPGEEQLFRLISLHSGEWFQNNYEIFVEDLKIGDRVTPSSFSIVLKDLSGTTVESWKNLNLDASSDNYIAKKIGNQSFSWDETDLKHNVRGLYVNKSDYFYVEVSEAVAKNTLDDTLALPMGFLGPLRPKRFQLMQGSENVHFWGDLGPDAYVPSEITPAAGNTTGIQFAEVLTGLCDGDDDAASQSTITITVPAAIAASGTETLYIIEFIDKDSSFSGAAAAGAKTVQVAAHGLSALGGTQALVGSIVEALNGDAITLSNRVRRNTDLDSGQSDFVASAVTTDVGATTGIKILSAATSGEGAITLTTATGTGGDVTKAVPAGAGTQTGNTSTNQGSGDPMTSAQVSVKGQDDMPLKFAANGNDLFCTMPTNMTGAVLYPALRMTVANSNRGGNYKRNDYFGVRHNAGSSANRDASYADLVYPLPGNYSGGPDQHQADIPSTHERSFRFHMEDVCVSAADNTRFYYQSGSFASQDAQNISYNNDQSELLVTKRIKQYRSAFYGGFDGLDIRDVEPFGNLLLTDKAAKTNAPFNTVMKALDMVRDPEIVEMDMISMPGATLSTLTDEILEVATQRGDALAVIDLPNGYTPSWEGGGSEGYGTLSTTLSNLEGRQLNNSYGCAYYPWVVIRDSNADVVPVPPSVAAIGAMAKSTADSDVWFAPAGFNRGGIKNLGSNNSGLVVTHTIEHLTKDNRDDLYALNVNPIARFPATNQIVIFGQKTLQQTASALDRINVRRLLLFLKRRIGKIADTILFEPNVQTTWQNFKNQADAVLSDVQARLGITEYKLVLDDSTTTADLIDRNVMYAKIFIKPARAIEFIVVDFVVTRSGVEF